MTRLFGWVALLVGSDTSKDQHRAIPMLHRTQLRQHTRLPPPRPLMDAAKRQENESP
jgi:hypothetical protein